MSFDMRRHPIGSFIVWYREAVVTPGKQPLVLLLGAFVITFLFIRLSVRLIRAGVRWWPGNVTPGGLHVHHVVFGVVFVMIAGGGAFSPIGHRMPWAGVFPALFGVGAALILDEFALILHLRDVYWSEHGRTSVDAVFLATAVCALILLGGAPLGLDGVEGGKVVLALTVVLNTVFVVLALLKGKYWTGLLGIFLPSLATVGALRLARPDSPWARWRYRPESAKYYKSRRREKRQRNRWVRRRRWLQDQLAGAPTVPPDEQGRP